MSGTRNVQPLARRGTPIALTPQPKPVISLEEWEAKAPLTDIQLKSVNAVKLASERIPLPLKFSVDEGNTPSRPSTPIARGASRGPLGSPSSPAPRLPSTHALQPTQPIQTPQQFYDWFGAIDRSVAHSQEAHFRAHLADLAEHLETCDRLVERIDEVDHEVEDMLQQWRSVEEGGESLKGACEKLLEERDYLIALTDDIGLRLEYFQELERATRMLNHPGESLVLQADFLYMVERVDLCIEYLRAHRHYREAEVYLLRFQQCMTRAMTLIKMFFVGSLRALTADVSRRISDKDVSATAQMHLLYTRFRTVSNQLAPLLRELERRAQTHPDELSALLAECHAAYFSARKGLLVNRLMEEIRGLDPARTELVELTRSGCSYLKQLCTDEFDLFRAFFDSGEDQLYAYLENLCDYLYDDLRPRILHEQRLTALCEVCTVLQALMVLDARDPVSSSSSSSGDSDGETEINDMLTTDPLGPRPRGLSQLHISALLQMVLQDAQTRLFFKAQAVVQAEIRHFTPTPADLAYPEKLVESRKPSEMELREKESVSELFKLPAKEKQDTWYPTLQKTVWVLSQLHDFVKPAIFEDIAQEAVNVCRQSLVAASETMRMKAPLDGLLFLVRHLFILKEMTQHVDMVQRDAGPTALADFSGGMTETLASVLNRTSALLPSALFASLGMPRADEGIVDAKLGIDQELKRACEDVITHCADLAAQPLRDWCARVRVVASTSPNKAAAPTQLAQQDWAAPAAVSALEVQFQTSCERELRNAAARMGLYLEDGRTIGVLLTHVRERVLDDYAEFVRLVAGLHEGRVRIMSESEASALVRRVCEGEPRADTSS